MGPDGRWQSRTPRGAGPKEHLGPQEPRVSRLCICSAPLATRWRHRYDALKTPLKSGFWRRFGEGHQTIRRSALILKQFANVIPVSQNENNSLGFLRLPGKGSGDLAWAKGGERDLSVAQSTTLQVRRDPDPRARRRLHGIGRVCSPR